MLGKGSIIVRELWATGGQRKNVGTKMFQRGIGIVREERENTGLCLMRRESTIGRWRVVDPDPYAHSWTSVDFSSKGIMSLCDDVDGEVFESRAPAQTSHEGFCSNVRFNSPLHNGWAAYRIRFETSNSSVENSGNSN